MGYRAALSGLITKDGALPKLVNISTKIDVLEALANLENPDDGCEEFEMWLRTEVRDKLVQYETAALCKSLNNWRGRRNDLTCVQHARAYVIPRTSLLYTLLSGAERISDLLPTFVIFLLMQHAWFPKIALTSALSGASWYLSALAFCWLMTPTIAYAIVQFRKLRITQGGNLQASLAAGLFFYGCMVILELMLRTTSVFAGLSLHSNPFVRLLEYATANAASNVFFESIPLASREAQAVIELMVSAAVPILWIRFDETWWRCTFFALSLLLTLSLCCGQSPISKVLSCKELEEASKYELCFDIFTSLAYELSSHLRW